MNDAPESLLAEARWLERMARSLVGDPHLAADLAQDTWLAVQSAPPHRGARRPWLLGVLRNLVLRAFRSGGRRQQRELTRGAATAAEATADLLARTELHGRLLQLVRELPESYRGPLLLRFFDQLPPRRIAARLGLPVNTVHTRIQRGLAMLRDRLDTDHRGDRRAWLAVLLRTTTPRALPTPRTGVLALAASLLTLAAVTVAMRQTGPTPPPTTPPGNALAAAPESPPPATSPGRTPPAVDADRNVALPTLRGCVVDWDGRPVADAAITIAPHLGILWLPDAGDTVELDAGPATTLPTGSDRDGVFTLPRPTQPIELRAAARHHTCVAVGIWRPDADEAPRVVLARATTVAGRVVDDEGRAVADASVRLELPTAGSGAGPLRGLHLVSRRATTAADGSFLLADAPSVAGARLHLTKVGHTAQVVPLAAANGPCTLPRWARSFGARVVDALGRPIAGAVVAGDGATATTDADGMFTLPGSRGPLRIAARGHRPTDFATTAGPTLALLEPDGAMVGRLLQPDGAPATGWSISLADPTCVGDPLAPAVLEAVAGGHGTLIHRTTTARDGSFRLTGLADRAYRLRCVDDATAATFVSAPLQPGPVHGLVLPVDLWLRELQLTLRTPDGAPLPRAHVSVQGTGYGLPSTDGDERAVLFSQGSSGRSDATGSVTLSRVPRQHVHLRIQHAMTGVVMVPIADALAGRLVLPRQGELLVRDSDPGRSRWFEVCAADGSILTVDCRQGICMQRAPRWTLVDGRSPVLTVPETAATVRFGDATGELGRQPLLVRPGALVFLDL